MALISFEEFQRAFQVGWRRDHRPGNVYLEAIDRELHELEDSLARDLRRLDLLRVTLRQLVKQAAALGSRRTKPKALLKSKMSLLTPGRRERTHFFREVEREFGVPLVRRLNELARSWREYAWNDGGSDPLGDMTLGRLAVEVARLGSTFQDDETLTLFFDMLPDYVPDEAGDLVDLCLLADRLCRQLAQLAQRPFDAVTLTTDLGEQGLGLSAEQRVAFRANEAVRIGAEMSGVEHRTLTSAGRLLLWIWQTERQLMAREQTLETRAEAISGQSLEQLRERLSIFESVSLSEQSQEELALELQVLCRLLLAERAGQLADALSPLIVWHYENDSSVVTHAFQTLYWRDRDTFWNTASLLLEHEDQQVIDFASQVLEQAEYSEEQGGAPEVFDRVKGIIADLLGVYEEEITPEKRFREDLEADSLDLVELIMAFEEEFDGEISDEDAELVITVGDAVNLVSKIMSTA